MRTACLFLSLCFASVAYGQQDRILTAGFWNVENLYDTIPSPFYDDSDYTPQGRLKWDGEKYGNKLSKIAEVLDSLALDVVGLAEIESEVAVRDLVRTLETPYNYIRLTGGDSRGMGLALLYKGDKFVPDTAYLVPSGFSREVLYVRGELLGLQVGFIVCHLPSRLNRNSVRERAIKSLSGFISSLLDRDPSAQLVVMGDFNCAPGEKPMKKYFPREFPVPPGMAPVFSPFTDKVAKGYGTYAYRGRWSMSDNIYLSPGFFHGNGFTYFGCGIYIRPYLLDYDDPSRRGFPLRTFSGGKYRNGYSDHLPVYVIFG
ncbi:MAG: hypothetical protein LUF87_08955 [Alistipes sp.]|nr:hypothetical protein [Alistipes sp.]